MRKRQRQHADGVSDADTAEDCVMRSNNSLSDELGADVSAAPGGSVPVVPDDNVPEEIEDDCDVEPPSCSPPDNCPWIVAGGVLKLVIVTVAMGAINVPRRILSEGTLFLMSYSPWIARLVAAYEAGSLQHKHVHFVFEGFVNLDRKKNKVGVDKFRQAFREQLRLAAKDNGGA